jgi:hypothetical protein
VPAAAPEAQLAAALLLACAAALAACTGPPRVAPATAATGATAASAAAPGSTLAPADPSFDWRRLPLAPLGTPYKALNPLVHEVLLFRDASADADPDADSDAPEDSARADARDCYAPNDTAPRFIGRPAERYLLCFHDDRLTRVQASVRFDPVEDAPAKLFATLCADWLAGAEPQLESATRCAGRDGHRAFSAVLKPAGEAETSMLSIVVYDVSER